MTFEDWYETYERDGGELMIFNAIDMRAAFEAGFEAGSKSVLNNIDINTKLRLLSKITKGEKK